MRDTEDLLHEAWLRDTEADGHYWPDDLDVMQQFSTDVEPNYDGFYRDDLGQLIEHENDTYTVFVLAEWTKVIDIKHNVPLDGVPYYADKAKFLAWDHPGGPITCQIYMIPSARVPEPVDRITSTMMRYASYVDGYDAQTDGAPTPLEVVTELHTA